MSLLDSALLLRSQMDLMRGERAAQQLALALNQQALYGASHPTVLQAAEQAADVLALLLAERAEVRLSLSNGTVLVDGQAVLTGRGHFVHLVRACARHAVDRIILSRGVRSADVADLVRLLGKSPEELEAHGGLSGALATPAITCPMGGTGEPSPRAGQPRPRLTVDASLLHTCTTALEVIEESAQHARVGRVLNASAARALASQLTDNVIEDQAELLGLLSIRRHDQYTFQHSLNICILALALGMACGLDRARLQDLGLAALLHDVGKAWVPLEVLRKPGPLDEEEFSLMKRHPVEGAVYLDQQLELPAAAAVVAFQHHLRYDQQGYPKLRWPQPASAYSLIVGIADAYEALTSERPYRPTRTPEDALKVMLATPPGQFEPRLLAVLTEMLGRPELLVGDRGSEGG